MMELRFEPKQFDSRICAFLHYTIPLRDQNKYQKCILNFIVKELHRAGRDHSGE